MKKKLLSSLLSLVLCFTLVVGSTYALFTSESKVNVAVTAGNGGGALECNSEHNNDCKGNDYCNNLCNHAFFHCFSPLWKI